MNVFRTFYSDFFIPHLASRFPPCLFSLISLPNTSLYTLLDSQRAKWGDCRASQRRNFNCTRAKRDFYCRFIYFSFPSPSFCFMRFFLFYGLPSSEIGFSLMFSYTLSRPSLQPLVSESASCAHRASEEFVWGQHNTKHFSFSLLLRPESLILRTIFHLFPSFIRSSPKNLSHI